jgi:hypothetical protein
MTVIRLVQCSGEQLRKALKNATSGRHLFFFDGEEGIAAACFKDSNEPNPKLEQLIAFDRARVDVERKFALLKCIRDAKGAAEDAPVLSRIECQAVAQLRAPYAEKVVHMVGGHVSRIGVNFFKHPAVSQGT